MRKYFAFILLIACGLISTGAEPVADETVSWQPAFAAISGSKADQTLVLMLITNDDAFASVTPGEGEQQATATQWCGPVFERSFRQARQVRADLQDSCVLQYMVAGTPQELTGGSPRNQPARAVVAVCDGNFQLLSFAVGVPDADELLTLIEDAQDAQAIIKLNDRDEAKVTGAIAQRSLKRLSRLWGDALTEMLAVIDVGNKDPNLAVDPDLQQMGRLGQIAETYNGVYLADVRLRFGLTAATDRTRLIILEQHPEARRPWCESMIPFLAGRDFVKIWKPLTESIWYAEPIVHDADAEDLLAWWDAQFETESFAIALQPPLLARRQAWPPVNVGSVADKRGLGWQDLQKLLLQLPYRSIDAEQLAILIRERELKPLDIQLPSRARYLFFEPKKKTAWVIHEGDIPGKHIGRVKRAMKK